MPRKAQAKPEEVQIPVVVAKNADKTSYANVFHTQPLDGGIALSCGISQPETRATAEGAQTVLSIYLEHRIMMTVDTANRLAQNLLQAVQQATAGQEK